MPKCVCCKDELKPNETILCSRCKALVEHMDTSIPYKERIENLRMRFYEKQKARLEKLIDLSKLRKCQHCAWRRYVDMEHRKVSCSSPVCMHE